MPASLISESVRSSQEFQSSLVRLVMWAVMVVILGVGGASGYYQLDWPLYTLLFSIHFVWFAALLVWCIHEPQLRPWRTYIAVASDLSATTLVIYLSGNILEPFFLVYILSFLSQGTRFGATNLAIASAGSVICYSLLALVMEGWWQHPVEVAFIVAALVVLPLYQNTLLHSLKIARRNAEIAKRARGDFLATMTHELRTPLSGVIGMARLLEGTKLDGDQYRYVRSLCSSADTLQSLIGDILDLSKVDAGALELEHARFNLRDTVVEVVDNLSDAALEKGVEPICCIDSTLPEFVIGDRVRFQQILYNLIGNAIKFTAAGHVLIEAHRCEGDARIDEPHLEIAISDTGIGIPADRLDCIFDSFWQADTSTSRRYGGTGLGTTIAARLAAAMGGYIDVDSREGEGSLFRVRLPAFSGHAFADTPPAIPEVLEGKTVLLFETRASSMDALHATCRNAGMRTLICSNETLIDFLNPGMRVDLILVADSPAGLDLSGIARRLREHCGPETPVLYLHYRGRSVFSDEYTMRISKPVHPASLLKAMADCITGRIKESESSPVPPRQTSRNESGEGSCNILVVEDDTTNAEMICILLRSWGHRVALAGNAAEALSALDETAFDLLLIDVRMPDMDGTELTREIRRRERDDEHVPIVALTANVAGETRTDCLAAGMDEFLTKPVDPRALDELLKRFVGMMEIERPEGTAESSP